MNYVVLGLFFLLSGFFMKFSDDSWDIGQDLLLAVVFGVFCAVTSALATVYSVGAAYIFIGILLGNLFALKIDGIHHVLTLFLFIIICMIFGVGNLNFIIILICILAALVDEIGHELIGGISGNGFIQLFFKYRFVMKIVVFLLAFCGAFSFWIFIFFILFELFYEFAGHIYKKINKKD